VNGPAAPPGLQVCPVSEADIICVPFLKAVIVVGFVPDMVAESVSPFNRAMLGAGDGSMLQKLPYGPFPGNMAVRIARHDTAIDFVSSDALR